VPENLSGNDERLNPLNKAIMERVQAGVKAFVAGTVLRGRFALRACILHYGTMENDIKALFKIVRRESAREPRT
jgi:hypothetical protein